MDTVSRVQKITNEGSGGKILQRRRAAAVRSPYARPTSPPPRQRVQEEEEKENPNWLFGFVAPATRAIAGAGKLISNVFFPDTPPSSSSSSEDDGSDDDVRSTEGASRSDQAAIPEANKCSQGEVHLRMQKSEVKLVVEQLLMQESFSRDECNRLVNIIQSRTLENEGENSRQSEFPDITTGSHIKLPGASPLDWQVTEGDEGSPVLVAKSYMKARPPWASPTLNHKGFQTSPAGMHLFKEESLYSFDANPLPSSKVMKRGSVVVDSCNNLDGIRRVRFKSAEAPSEHVDSSILELENKGSKNPAEAEIRDNLAVNGGTQAFSSGSATFTCHHTQDIEDDQVFAGEVHANPVIHEPPSESSLQRHNGSVNESAEVVISDPNTKPSEDFKHALVSDSNGLLGVDDIHESSMQPEAAQLNNSSQPKHADSINDPSSLQENHSTEKEVNESRDTVVANGFPLSSSLCVEINTESSPKAGNEGDANPISSSDGKIATDVSLGQSCELLSESLVEVPINDDTDSFASGDTSSRQSEELRHPKREILSAKRRASARIEKQAVKKTGKYSRRGRG